MAESNLDIARRGFEAWNRGEPEWFESNTTEDVEVRTAEVFPDLEDVYNGRDGWQRFWETFRAAWRSVEVTIESLEDAAPDEVLALVRFDGIGRGSGATVSLGFGIWLTFRDEKLARMIVQLPGEAQEEMAERRAAPQS